MKKSSFLLTAFLFFVAMVQMACQLAQPAPEPLQVSTPTPPNNTQLQPLPTFSPAKTQAVQPTATLAQQNSDFSKSSLTPQADGTTLFTDLKGGYSLVFPASWTLVRINENEYSELMVNQAIEDSLLQTYLMAYRQRDGNTYRLIGFDLEKRVKGVDYLTNIEIYLDDSELITTKQARINLQRARETETIIVEALASEDITTSAGYEAGVYRAVLETRAVTAQKARIYYSAALFTPDNSKLLVITFGTPVELRADFENFMDELIATYRETGSNN